MCRIQSRRHCYVDISCNLSKHAPHNKWKIRNKHILESMNQQVTHSSKSVLDVDMLNMLSFIIFTRIAKNKSRTARNRKHRWIKYELGQFIFFQKAAFEIM